MARHKSADTLDKKRRRMPFTAKIKREDPFCSADQREIHAMCRRIAGAAEHCLSAGWREESGYLLYHFTTWAKGMTVAPNWFVWRDDRCKAHPGSHRRMAFGTESFRDLAARLKAN